MINVWWLVKRALYALLEATSPSTRGRVRVYKNGEDGADKLLVRFAPHALPPIFPGVRRKAVQAARPWGLKAPGFKI